MDEIELNMLKTVYPSFINGSVIAPPSKSMSQRVIVAALLARGLTTIHHPSYCDDSVAALKMAANLGADVVESIDEITILGGFLVRMQQLYCGESGLAMRMFAPVAALHRKPITFTGGGSLLNRPVNMIGEALEQLGARFTSNNGLLPFTVQGPLKGGHATIDGSISSQLLTGLLLALPLAEMDSIIHINNLKSKPYIAMTLQLLRDFGVEVRNENYEVFTISGKQEYKASDYTIEGDWSGGAFLLVAGALAGNVTVRGLRLDSEQADKAILDVLKLAGANTDISNDQIKVSKSDLHAFDFDATECPDLFPPIAALAASCKGTSRISGVERLAYKESNRATTLQEELAKLGIIAEIDGNEMKIAGGKSRGGEVNSHNDHRVAMMAGVMALNSEKPIAISGAESVVKSYPSFFKDIAGLGVKVV